MKPPDHVEKGIRLGCGAFLGLFVGVLVGLEMFPYGKWSILGVAVSIGIACSLAARYLGDEFWFWILWILSWWG